MITDNDRYSDFEVADFKKALEYKL